MGTPDSREYDRLKDRNFGPYSQGHRNMYELAIKDLGKNGFGYGQPTLLGEDVPLTSPTYTSARVLEAGFGIGWGLDRMMDVPGLLHSYVGYEPNRDSFNYVKGRYPEASVHGGRMLLLNLPFEPNLDPAFDVAFCIEVIEHVPMGDHAAFLKGLHTMAPVLYFSTPDYNKVPSEGVRNKGAWLDLLAGAGFSAVLYDESNWTTFYRASR